ncbi:MAG: hypothetical protein WC937_06715 [Candidatus Omnitrophota bacterium]
MLKSKKFFYFFLPCFFLFTPLLAEDSITITTYYPSPYGVYREMRAKRIAIGDDYIQGDAYTWEEENGDGGEIDYLADLVVEGNVGIGTVNPTFSIGRGLHISGVSGTPDAVIRLSETTSGFGNFEFRSTARGTSGNRLEIGEGSDTFLTIRSDDDEGGTTSRGNVGIGTTKPRAKLNVMGTIQLGGDTGPGSTGVYLATLCDGCGGGCSRILNDGYLGWSTADTFQGADVIGKDDAFDASCYIHSVGNIYCGAIPVGYCYPIIFSVRFN